MSILDKHPAPWTAMRHGPECTAYDANGTLVCEIGDGEPGREALQNLILSVPELLAAVMALRYCNDWSEELLAPVDALIARIEGK
jgi:hypothetical protein